MSAARVVTTQTIARAKWTCCCGTELDAELDEDAVMLIREAMLLHRTCIELPAYDHEVFEVEDDVSDLEDD